MATRSMFLRILWKLLGASRGRLALALVALSSGAAVSSALLNVNLDAERKLTQEFRTLGANVVVAPPSGGSDAALADAERHGSHRRPAISADCRGSAVPVRRRKFRNAACDFGGHLV